MLRTASVSIHLHCTEKGRKLSTHAHSLRHTHAACAQSLSTACQPPLLLQPPVLRPTTTTPPPTPKRTPGACNESGEKRGLLSLLEPMHPMVYSQRPWIQAWKCYPDTVHSPSSSYDSLSLSLPLSAVAFLSCALSSPPAAAQSLTHSLSLSLSLPFFLSTSLPLAPSIQCSVLEEMRLVSQYAWGNDVRSIITVSPPPLIRHLYHQRDNCIMLKSSFMCSRYSSSPASIWWLVEWLSERLGGLGVLGCHCKSDGSELLGAACCCFRDLCTAVTPPSQDGGFSLSVSLSRVHSASHFTAAISSHRPSHRLHHPPSQRSLQPRTHLDSPRQPGKKKKKKKGKKI